ncbi:MAG: hypothetical protein H6993_05315 [Pseudomonadales bacterium]|nr:hypothetical protein [Pseudomonadales bacterium]MCP5183360.1 hypothetical protein [Pseudomonadales bacterium]
MRQYTELDLPAALRSTELIPFLPGREKIQREAFWGPETRDYVVGRCMQFAYTYLRSENYWLSLDSSLARLNTLNGLPELPLDRDNAAALCASPDRRESLRSQLPGKSTRLLDNLCLLATPNGRASFDPSPASMPTGHNICFDLDRLRSDEVAACMQTEGRTTLKTPGLTFADYCACAGDRRAASFASGKYPLDSNTLVQTSVAARLACDPGKTKVQPAKADKGGSTVSAQATSEASGEGGVGTSIGDGEQKAKQTLKDSAEKAKESVKKGFKKVFNW